MSLRPVIAVTGSNGYVGSGLKDYFAANGWDVIELTRRPRPGSGAVDFQLGRDLSPAALKGATALVHCAYDFAPTAWTEISRINVGGTKKLFHTARAAGVKKVIHFSTISAFNGCRSLYGQAKLACETDALDAGALVLRPGLVYGVRPGGMFGKLARQVQNSTVLPMMGDGSQVQFLAHQEDLNTFVGRCVRDETEMPEGILTAAHEAPWPFRELLREIARHQNRSLTLVPVPWRLVWAGLRLAETCGLKPGFRSDSLMSLMHQNPRPDFSRNSALGLIFRPFGANRDVSRQP